MRKVFHTTKKKIIKRENISIMPSEAVKENPVKHCIEITQNTPEETVNVGKAVKIKGSTK